ncbi:MAG: DinB family protein [Acidobacteriia bacterium]|nr:DinB family protein [Terriglobia bacterium]
MKARSLSLLEEALGAWAYTRDGVVAEVKNLPEPALDFKPTGASRTARELVQHIIESGLLMSGELPRPDGDFQRKPYPELLAEHASGVLRHRTKAALLSALKRTHADGATRLRSAGEVGMLQAIRQFNGEPATRFSWMHHAIAHEEYHRGQLALYARLVGRVPALTKLIHGG